MNPYHDLWHKISSCTATNHESKGATNHESKGAKNHESKGATYHESKGATNHESKRTTLVLLFYISKLQCGLQHGAK